MAERASREQLETMLARRGFAATLRAETSQELPVLYLQPGVIVELVPEEPGRPSSGLTSLAMNAAVRRSGKVVWIDPADRLDPGTARCAGLDFAQLLWLRGGDATAALRAALLILQAGGFELIVLDLLDQPEGALDFSRSVWYRLLRGLERERRTALLLLARRPLAGTCADRVIEVRYQGWRWNTTMQPLLDKVTIESRVRASRRTRPERYSPVSVLDCALDTELTA